VPVEFGEFRVRAQNAAGALYESRYLRRDEVLGERHVEGVHDELLHQIVAERHGLVSVGKSAMKKGLVHFLRE